MEYLHLCRLLYLCELDRCTILQQGRNANLKIIDGNEFLLVCVLKGMTLRKGAVTSPINV